MREDRNTEEIGNHGEKDETDEPTWVPKEPLGRLEAAEEDAGHEEGHQQISADEGKVLLVHQGVPEKTHVAGDEGDRQQSSARSLAEAGGGASTWRGA